MSDEEQQQGFYIRYHTEALLRSDQAKFSMQMLTEVNGGIRTLNEGRRELGLPPVGPEGDKLRVPVNFQPRPMAARARAREPEVRPGRRRHRARVRPPSGSGDGTAEPTPGPAPAAAAEDDTEEDDAVERGLPGVLITNPLESPANYAAIIDPLVEDAARRVEIKTEKAIAAKRGSEQFHRLAQCVRRAAERYAKEAFAPIVVAASALGKKIDLDRIASRYEMRVKQQKRGELATIAKGVIHGNEK